MLSIVSYLSFSAASQQQQVGMPWWVWFLLFVVIIFIFAMILNGLGLGKGGQDPAMPFKNTEEIKKEVNVQVVAPAKVQAVAPAPLQTKDDDLTMIEGIGPKISAALKEVGITTFAQLAVLDLDTLKKTLRDANLNLADPTSWAEQSQLLVEGKMDELKALQDSLKAGRRA